MNMTICEPFVNLNINLGGHASIFLSMAIALSLFGHVLFITICLALHGGGTERGGVVMNIVGTMCDKI